MGLSLLDGVELTGELPEDLEGRGELTLGLLGGGGVEGSLASGIGEEKANFVLHEVEGAGDLCTVGGGLALVSVEAAMVIPLFGGAGLDGWNVNRPPDQRNLSSERLSAARRVTICTPMMRGDVIVRRRRESRAESIWRPPVTAS